MMPWRTSKEKMYPSSLPASQPQEAFFREWVDIARILMESIEGFAQTNLDTYAPKTVWQFVGDEALRIVHAMSERVILNEHVQRRSFIVNPKK